MKIGVRVDSGHRRGRAMVEMVRERAIRNALDKLAEKLRELGAAGERPGQQVQPPTEEGVGESEGN